MRGAKPRRPSGRSPRGLAYPLAKRCSSPTSQALSTKWTTSWWKPSWCVGRRPSRPVPRARPRLALTGVSLSWQACSNKAGVSYQSVLKYIVNKYPGLDIEKKKFLIKKAMKKHLEKGTIKQVRWPGRDPGRDPGGSWCVLPSVSRGSLKPRPLFHSLCGTTMVDVFTLFCALCPPAERKRPVGNLHHREQACPVQGEWTLDLDRFLPFPCFF